MPLLLIAGTIVLLDQASKSLIRANLALGEVYRPELWITQFARLVHLHNSGAAIGIFPSLGKVFMFLAILISGAIIYYYPRIPHQERLLRLSMALLLGGALGNLIDRLQQGYVTDFISVLNIPVVNLADLSVSVGVILLCISLWRQEEKKERQRASTHPGEEPPGEHQGGQSLSMQTPPKDVQSE
jgi:signal peptidase II